MVLTLKGLHYYVRQPGKDASRRDLFGQHDGSVGLSNIARIEAAREEGAKGGERDYLTSITIVSKGGRHYHFRAKTPQLLTRWYSALENAIAPTPKPSTTSSHLSLSQLSRSASGRHLTTFSSRVQGGSFHRAPTFIDFRTAVPTDNLVYLSLKSAKLKLEVLLESGMPWGAPGVNCDEGEQRTRRDTTGGEGQETEARGDKGRNRKHRQGKLGEGR